MIIALSNENLLEDFLYQHEIETALVITKHEKKAVYEKLGIEIMSKGEYYIIVDPPVGSYAGIRGWMWVNGELRDLNAPDVLSNRSE